VRSSSVSQKEWIAANRANAYCNRFAKRYLTDSSVKIFQESL